MDNKFFVKMRSKKGTTMVEVLAAVLILALVVTAVLTTIGFSQRMILSNSSETAAAAQAQGIADALITKLQESGEATVKNETVLGAGFAAEEDFPDASKDKQFTFAHVEDDKGIAGYKIKTAVYFTDGSGRKCVQMTAFAAEDGGTP
nr:type II secretion system protein [uncultured Caproiciproducens sp.]